MAKTDYLKELLGFIYGKDDADSLLSRLVSRIEARVAGIHPPASRVKGSLPLDQKDAFMITYGDQFQDQLRPSLQCLEEFAQKRLAGCMSGIHILPFFPYTSDDGFSISDYKAVHDGWGDWPEISSIGASFRLMSDLVLNHCSASHEWFQAFLRDEEEYRDFFITEDPETDLSMVVRPRALPLLTPFETDAGVRHVWTTFSADQVDLNFGNPQVLIEMVDVFLFHVEMGVQIIRLDAIAYLWKEIGHSCLHHPKTHAVVKLFREVVKQYVPWVLILTETNVPHKENISYFGNGEDEAQMIYQFSLPPLTLDAFLRQDAGHLRDWAATLPPVDGKTTYFNFMASHDGVGVTPAHGILSDDELAGLLSSVEERGGRVSYKATATGKIPYEMNINYCDAVAGDVDDPEMKAEKFIASQSILLAMPGVPGIYVHSLIGSGNWTEGMELTGMNRTINRQKLDLETVSAELDHKGSLRSRIFSYYTRLLTIRRGLKAFDPSSPFGILEADGPVFAVSRGAEGKPGRIICLVNVSDSPSLWKVDPASGIGDAADDLVGGSRVAAEDGSIRLAPYQVLWLSI